MKKHREFHCNLRLRKKIVRIMKLTTLLILTLFMSVHATGYSQATKLNLSLKNESLVEALKQIEDQSEFYFYYNNDDVLGIRDISVDAKSKNIDEVLSQLLQNTGLDYKMIDRYIVIKRKEASEHSVFGSQQKPINGKVTDSAGLPLPGVTVVVKGTTTGTITNLEGNYSLPNIPSDGTLVFSFVGMRSQEVFVGMQSVINVSFQEETIGLEEVVAVGYGTQKKVNLTGAVGNVTMEDLESRPLTNSSVALQGKVSGVYALQKSGKPGGDDAVINIRGVGTLNNSDPLVLIDGFPGNMNDVSASDIKSISVLKDASSAAIYGNRAANGVILITTKRGSVGKMTVSYNGYYGVQAATSLPDVFNSVEYTTLYNEAAVNSGMQPRYTAEDIQKYASGTDPMYPDINYFDVYYDKAKIQNHRVNINGGTETLQYAFMLGYLDQEGILVGTNYEKVDFRSNFDSYFLKDKKLRLSARLSGNKGNTNEPTDEWNAKWYAATAPNWPLKNTSDQWIAVIGERNFYGEIMEGSTRKIDRYVFNSQIEGEYKIAEGLSAQITYGYNVIHSNSNSFHANVLLANLDGSTRYLTSDLTERNDLNTQTLLTSLLRYEKKFGKHELNVLAGYSEEEFNWKWSSGYRSKFINNTQRILNLGDPSTMQNNAGAYDLGLQSVFGRINYIFAEKYLFEANIRRDGSSRFGEDFKWGTFPSFSVGWIISEESFLKNQDWLDILKIRGSWGQLGNQNINTYYAASDILNTGVNYTTGGGLNSGVAVTSMSNKQTTWETSEQTNFGVDFSFNRNFDITLDYFSKKTNDILIQVPIPITMGNLTPPYQNVGEVKNRGLELSATYRKTFTNGLKFNSTLSLSHIKNEITDLYGRSPIINGATALVEGSAIHSFYGYKMDGIYQISDFTWQNNSDPSITHADRNYVLKDGVVSVANFTATPGDVKYRDISGDGVVSMDKDRTVIGKQYPDLAYSLQLNLDWKQFDLGLFFQGLSGIDGYTYYEIAVPYSGAASNNGAWWTNRWTPENPTNELPKLTLDGVRSNIHSELYMEDASYLRLKNIELGYTLSQRHISKLGISKVRIYGNVQNAFTITNYKGFDPEQTTDETRAQAYPQVRIVTLGLNVNF
ncbi:TonB-dependent receptor [Gaoshiqia sp. Z1-71]|uniref:TonB-dependent receptor n=1 Tax=Gaoshiqia hydrogeniformans TaxID=3290090 RepID=UPI003BF7E29B